MNMRPHTKKIELLCWIGVVAIPLAFITSILWIMLHVNHPSVASLAVSPDGAALAVAGGTEKPYGGGGFLSIWDLTVKQKRTTLTNFESKVNTVAFSPDGRFLACGTASIKKPGFGTPAPQVTGQVVVVEVGANRIVSTYDLFTSQVMSIAYSPDGSDLAIGGGMGEIAIVRVASSERMAGMKTSEARYVTSLAFSSDGKIVASAVGHYVDLWSARDGRLLERFGEEEAMVSCIAFSPGFQHHVAYGRADGVITIVDVARLKRLATFQYSSASVQAISFSPDGNKLAVGGEDQIVRIWDVDTPEPRVSTTLRGADGLIKYLLFSGANASLTAGVEHEDGSVSVVIWNIESKSIISRCI